jgi:hypothetical protein
MLNRTEPKEPEAPPQPRAAPNKILWISCAMRANLSGPVACRQGGDHDTSGHGASSVCTLQVAKSTAQSAKESEPQAESNASPIYGITIPAGYRDWRLISVAHLAGGKLKQLRAQLGNDVAIMAFREGKLSFPDGTIIAALHWDEASSDENDKVLASGFPGAGLQSSVAGASDVRLCQPDCDADLAIL